MAFSQMSTKIKSGDNRFGLLGRKWCPAEDIWWQIRQKIVIAQLLQELGSQYNAQKSSI